MAPFFMDSVFQGFASLSDATCIWLMTPPRTFHIDIAALVAHPSESLSRKCCNGAEL